MNLAMDMLVALGGVNSVVFVDGVIPIVARDEICQVGDSYLNRMCLDLHEAAEAAPDKDSGACRVARIQR
jgi:hypothetical protein